MVIGKMNSNFSRYFCFFVNLFLLETLLLSKIAKTKIPDETLACDFPGAINSINC
jgi:hypothetical protein